MKMAIAPIKLQRIKEIQGHLGTIFKVFYLDENDKLQIQIFSSKAELDKFLEGQE